MTPKNIHGAPSWVLETHEVSMAVSCSGGHMAPVSFLVGDRRVQPYSLPPWRADACDYQGDRVTQVLRGDFFCIPFGGRAEIRFPHGDSANLEWTLEAASPTHLSLSLESASPKASLRKEIHLKPGQTALYIEHEIRGAQGRHSYGHHEILHMPESAPPALLSMSPPDIGEVVACDLNDPAIGQRSVLVPGARVEGLDRLPRRDGTYASLATYPALDGCEETVLFGYSPGKLAWAAAVMDGYVWFSLKRTDDFPCTLLWVSNGGRDFSPWAGTHDRRIGMEDICAYAWLEEDAPGAAEWHQHGVATGRNFQPDEPVTLRHIQAVAPVPLDSGPLRDIEFLTGGEEIRLIFASGESVVSAVDWKFLNPASYQLPPKSDPFTSRGKQPQMDAD